MHFFLPSPLLLSPGVFRLKKYAALVRFVSADEVRVEFFTPDTVPDDFKSTFLGSQR